MSIPVTTITGVLDGVVVTVTTPSVVVTIAPGGPRTAVTDAVSASGQIATWEAAPAIPVAPAPALVLVPAL